MSTGSPIKFNVDGGARLQITRIENTVVFDSKVFQRYTNKVEDIGYLRKRKFVIECNGQGNIHFREIKDPFKEINELGKLYSKGYLTEEDFERKKKEILDRI